MKRVSVILVNYNGMPHLDACISSVLRQSYGDFEVIMVDNNSQDGSLEYARSKFPELRFLENDGNLGYAGGINTGLAHATGDYIAPLNIDTEVAPDWLSTMVSFLDAHPQAGAVTPKILLFDQRTRINAMGLNIHVTGLGFCRGLGREDDNSAVPERVPGLSGCSYLIRHHLLEEMGGAPAECFMANDDVIVSWLLHLMGFDIYCVPGAVVYHKYRLKMNPQKLYSLEKNRQALLLYTLRPMTFVACSPVLVVTELLITGYCLLKGKAYLKSKLGAFSSVWKDRDRIKQKRELCSQLRRISDFRLLRKLKWSLELRQVAST